MLSVGACVGVFGNESESYACARWNYTCGTYTPLLGKCTYRSNEICFSIIHEDIKWRLDPFILGSHLLYLPPSSVCRHISMTYHLLRDPLDITESWDVPDASFLDYFPQYIMPHSLPTPPPLSYQVPHPHPLSPSQPPSP